MGTLTTDVARGGLLLVDKPAGITSHDVVSIVRRSANTRRVGHAGTLDPFATGLLVMLLGPGTRLLPFMDGEPKVYDATIAFGCETDTDDATGVVTREAPPPLATEHAVDEAIAKLTGALDQIPPAYSAKKVGGTRAYAAARRGKKVDLAPARVVVHRWEILSRDSTTINARITCSGGTYIRALARDVGRLAGSAAHLAALRRLRSGVFDVADAATVDAIRAGEFDIRPLRDAIPSLATRELNAAELARVVHGNPVIDQIDDGSEGNEGNEGSEGSEGSEAPALRRLALIDTTGELVAIAERSGVELRPKVVLRDA